MRVNLAVVLSAVAVLGWMTDTGLLPVPAPIRDAASSAEAWRDERVAALRCRAAALAALASGDDEEVVRRLEVACGATGDGSYRFL